ncbi:hypothetical protein [Candidatus Sororendozoicomonas aggregata]|uniref:hypothetical protein n=1 Tax=Candidatus Sororendozoicomonas aggregata TaxID=3073239 RepID=UPI002ED0AC7E
MPFSRAFCVARLNGDNVLTGGRHDDGSGCTGDSADHLRRGLVLVAEGIAGDNPVRRGIGDADQPFEGESGIIRFLTCGLLGTNGRGAAFASQRCIRGS